MARSRKRKLKKPVKSMRTAIPLPAEMRTAIETFNRNTDDIVNSFKRELDKQPPPSIIYHYTYDDGLRGIIETGKLWFTDIFKLNDPSELRHGLEPAIKLLTPKYDDNKPEIKKFSDNLEAMLWGGPEEVAELFVCCFSKACDDLGQWRAYADNGRGFALGFDAQILEQAFVNAVPGPRRMTFPVNYGEDELREMHRKILEQALPLISMPRGRNLQTEAINTYMSELLIYLSLPIFQAALFFKHAAYSNEQEYRFLEMFTAKADVPDLKYRGRSYSLTRYREFDWRTVVSASLKKIVVGPAADRAKATQFARDCLRLFHVGTVDIECSKIPYRAA